MHATSQVGSQAVESSSSQRFSQMSPQVCAHDERHSPILSEPAQSSLQSCWQLDMHRPREFGGSADSAWVSQVGVQEGRQVSTHSTAAVATHSTSQPA